MQRHRAEGSSARWSAKDEEAIEYARRFLRLDVFSWTDKSGSHLLGIETNERKSELRHIIAALEVIGDKDNLTADNLLDIKLQLDRLILALKRAQSAKGKRGQSRSSYSARYVLIAKAVDVICKRFGYHPTRNPATKDRECGCSIIAQALCRNGDRRARSEKRVAEIWYSRQRKPRAN
jgi:hypothetical protein